MSKQDDLEHGRFLFRGKCTFHEAFPTIKTLSITVRIYLKGKNLGPSETRYFTLESPPSQFIRCPRVNCRDGDWDICTVLHDMVRVKQLSATESGICSGKEYIGRKPGRECLTFFEADISMTLKQAA